MEKAVLCLFVGTSNCYVVLLPIYCDFTLAVSGSETLISDGKAAYRNATLQSNLAPWGNIGSNFPKSKWVWVQNQ